MFITLSFLATVGNIILFLFVLGLVICIHELGHLVFAKRAGILCHEFSFGMGPRIWSKKKGETLFSIRAIPFGGFVSMAGEEIEAEVLKIGQKIRLGFNRNNEVNRIVIKSKDPNFQDFLEVSIEDFDISSEEGNRLYINEYTVNRKAMYILDNNHIQIAPKDRSFVNKSKSQRFWATFGGPLMNFILAFFVFLLMTFIAGVPDSESTVVSEVSKGTPAYGLIMDGDQIVSINGVDITSWSGETNSVSSELAKTLDSYDIVVERDGVLVELDPISPQFIFYGLGFTSDPDSEDLVIETPLYINTELLPGDELLSIEGIDMTSWEDVITFAQNNTAGSEDKEDLYDVLVYRYVKPVYNGVVENIYLDPLDVNYSYINVLNDESTIDGEEYPEYSEYRYHTSETITVEVGDRVTAGDQLSSGSEFTFSYVMYGQDILEVMGATTFASRIGIAGTNNFNFFKSFPASLSALGNAATSIFKTLYLLFASPLIGVSDLSGFVGIFSMTSSAAAAGIISLLSWIGLLSVNLGIVNLLPIPALDGGRLVFIGYEAIFRKKPNQKVENALHTVMFFLLMALLIFITYNDILRLFK